MDRAGRAARLALDGWTGSPSFPADAKWNWPTPQRHRSRPTAIGRRCPSCGGGSGRPAESNLNHEEGEPRSSRPTQNRDVAGQPVRADDAVRHPRARMGAILNGISLPAAPGPRRTFRCSANTWPLGAVAAMMELRSPTLDATTPSASARTARTKALEGPVVAADNIPRPGGWCGPVTRTRTVFFGDRLADHPRTRRPRHCALPGRTCRLRPVGRKRNGPGNGPEMGRASQRRGGWLAAATCLAGWRRLPS